MSRRFKHHLATSVATVLAALAMSAGGTRSQAATAASDVAVGDILAQTVYLPLRNQAGAEAAAKALQTPGPGYHKFLSVGSFVQQFAASDSDIRLVETVLKGLGYTIGTVYPNHLAIEVTSSAGTAERTLGVTLKRFTVDGHAGMASTTQATLPAALRGLVRGIGGLDSVTRPHPMSIVGAVGHVRTARPLGTALTGGSPGNYLPADFARIYHVDPLYALGVHGRGSTIGIVTLANYYPSDAYLFWKQIGLDVSPSRISTVDVDGGTSIAPSDALGEDETDLDIQQSGGLAPDAKLRVYVAPNNTNANFINGFEAAASDNIADTVSSSWGEAESDYFANVATGTAGDSYELDAFHDAFLEMALQGQSLFIAAGDSGAFDTVDECPSFGTPSAGTPVCNAPYAVDHPAADPLVTSAGGTTLPFSLTFDDGVTISVAQEQAWGWDYIASQAAAQGHAADFPVSELFSTGGGGGVSSYWARPWYQAGVRGITSTKPGQSLTQDNGAGPVTQLVLPSGFAGRNGPDLSANADPESGYQLVEEGVAYNFGGGTSFVAPQLNGVTALLVQGLGGRVGSLNPALYELSSLVSKDVGHGDNWGYRSAAGYENADGNGSLDATRLAAGLAALTLIR